MSAVDVRQATGRFKIGDKVRLRGGAADRGVVTAGPFSHPGGYAYEVMIGGEFPTYDESQLEPLPADDMPRWVRGRDELLVSLLLAKLRHPLTEGLYAYRASRTEFQAYQFRPALKFLRNGGRGLLIADEVGLGKTIEAAIIYLELKARLEINRVFVLCPSRLTGKWKDELRNRFEETFEIVDANGIRRIFSEFERIGTALPIRAIASFETMRRKEFVERWDELDIPLDLLIVDEAHHLRNEGNRVFQLGQRLTTAADANIFLSATPLHLGNRDLFNLLSLLSPDDFPDFDLFKHQIDPNQHILRASKHVEANEPREAYRALRQVEQTALKGRFTKNPFYRSVVDRLGGADGGLELVDAVEIQRELMDLNTLASVLTRTRKREMTNAAVRAATTVKVSLTPAEREVYDAVLADVRARVAGAGKGAPAFGAVMPERQAASCLPVVVDRIREGRQSGQPVDLAIDRSAFDLGDEDDERVALDGTRLHLAAARPQSIDSKLLRLHEVLDGALRPYPASKALVFSFFRGTLDYLEQRLREQGWNVAKIHGRTPIAERRRIIERFRVDDACRMMLSSEVGAEGLDFQFCDVLVNYDLPWNPMQVEQRIGRLDRFGQKAERIRIFNFYLDDTIETRIFERLYERIGIFERSIGDLEAILGEVIGELTRDVLQHDLTPEEQARRAIECAQMILKRQQEEDAFERHKDELIGQSAILDRQVESAIQSGSIISSNEVRALISAFLRQEFAQTRLAFDDEEPCAKLEMDATLSEQLRRFVERNRLHHRVSNHLKEAMGNGRNLVFTYDSELARQRPNLEFVTIHHPLAEMARDYWTNRAAPGIPCGVLTMKGAADERGCGYFFVYLIDVRAARRSVSLKPVIVLDSGALAIESASTVLGTLLGDEWMHGSVEYATREFVAGRQRADEAISVHRRTIEDGAIMRNEAILAARCDALRRSYATKIDRTWRQYETAAENRIKRMREGQARRLEERLRLKLAELGEGRVVNVSSRLIIGGRIRLL